MQPVHLLRYPDAKLMAGTLEAYKQGFSSPLKALYGGFLAVVCLVLQDAFRYLQPAGVPEERESHGLHQIRFLKMKCRKIKVI